MQQRFDINREDPSGMDDDSGPALGRETGPGDVIVLAEANHTLVILHGDIDQRCADDLEYAGRFAIDASRRTIMDLRRVTLMDSVGLSFVIRLAASLRRADAELLLRGPSPRVAELITLVGADHLVRWTHAVGEGGDLPYAAGA